MFGPRWNRAVDTESVAFVIDRPIPIASDEPNMSTSISPGWCRSSPCLVSWLNMVPEEMTTRRLSMSHRPGSASRARRIGLAKASPTMLIEFTRSRSIVSSSSIGANDRLSSSTTQPAWASAPKETIAPVPCMSGAAGSVRKPGFVTRS